MNRRHRPENDPRLPRNLADTVAIYAVVVVVALVALVPSSKDPAEAEAMKLAGKPPAAERPADTGNATDR